MSFFITENTSFPNVESREFMLFSMSKLDGGVSKSLLRLLKRSNVLETSSSTYASTEEKTPVWLGSEESWVIRSSGEEGKSAESREVTPSELASVKSRGDFGAPTLPRPM